MSDAAGTQPVYCTRDEFLARAHSTALPISRDTGTVDHDRIDTLLISASAWCVGQIPGTLIDDAGELVDIEDVPPTVAPLLVHVCSALVEHWLTPIPKRSPRCEEMQAASLQRVTKLLGLL